VEGAIDFQKDLLQQYAPNRCKMLCQAISFLTKQLNMVDNTFTINHKDPTETLAIGHGGQRVPENMTSLCNYILRLNPNHLKETSHGRDGDALDSIQPGERKGNKNSNQTCYFTFFLSSDVEPSELISQVSYEFMNVGAFLRVKDLQTLDSESPIIFHNLYSLNHKPTIQAEINHCFELIHADMYEDDFMATGDHPIEWALMAAPTVLAKLNVPRISRPRNSAVNKIPKHMVLLKKVFHGECDSKEKQRVEYYVAHGKRKGIFKEILGPHVHVTTVTTYDSTPGDIRRADKFHMNTINYNFSMTSTDVPGFTDLNHKVDITEGGNVIQRVSLRYCLLSLFKLKDKSPLIAEVHQLTPGDSIQVVHPNIPEAEALLINMQKHAGGFIYYDLTDAGIDDGFIKAMLRKFVDPMLVHEVDQCQWDSATRSITTPSELEEDGAGKGVEEMPWYKDIVKQYEELQVEESGGKNKKKYAAQHALFDLDGIQSVKTMHEKNDNVVNLDEMEEELDEGTGKSTNAKAAATKVHMEEEVSTIGDDTTNLAQESDKEEELDSQDGLQEGLAGKEASTSKQSGSTPISVGVRFSNFENDTVASGGTKPSSHSSPLKKSYAATASAAGRSAMGAGKAG
jgi:hypothetical protein